MHRLYWCGSQKEQAAVLLNGFDALPDIDSANGGLVGGGDGQGDGDGEGEGEGEGDGDGDGDVAFDGGGW